MSRRSVVIVTSSGLVVSMFAAPAAAAPASADRAVRHSVDISPLTASARAVLDTSLTVTVPVGATWELDTALTALAVTPAACRSGLPASIGAFQGDQIVNAAQVINAATDLGLDVRGQTIAVMTAIGESTLTNIDRGDAAGPDSRGLFQQRANGAWGSYADRMTPRTAATSFLTALQQVPGWESMAPTAAAHAVQGNADPTYYTPSWDAAVQIVTTLDSDPSLAARVPATGVLPC